MGCCMLAIGGIVCQREKGQGKLMGSIRCTQIPFILITISQSHHSPLSPLYSADPLVDPQTHTGTSTVELFLCHDSHDLLCLPTYVLCLVLFCHNHILSHLLFVNMINLLTVSSTLGLLIIHSLFLSIFS